MAGGVWGCHGSCGASGRLPCHLWCQRAQEVSVFGLEGETYLYHVGEMYFHNCETCYVSCLFVGNLQRKTAWRIRTIQTSMEKLTKPLKSVTMNKLDSESTGEQRSCPQCLPLVKHPITA